MDEIKLKPLSVKIFEDDLSYFKQRLFANLRMPIILSRSVNVSTALFIKLFNYLKKEK